MVLGLANFWYWNLLGNGIERKNFGPDESWYIALLPPARTFWYICTLLIMILILTNPIENDSHSRCAVENDSHSYPPS